MGTSVAPGFIIKTLIICAAIFAALTAVCQAAVVLLAPMSGAFSGGVVLLGLPVSYFALVVFAVTAALVCAALVFRFKALPSLSDLPGSMQGIAEAFMDAAEGYTAGRRDAKARRAARRSVPSQSSKKEDKIIQTAVAAMQSPVQVTKDAPKSDSKEKVRPAIKPSSILLALLLCVVLCAVLIAAAQFAVSGVMPLGSYGLNLAGVQLQYASVALTALTVCIAACALVFRALTLPRLMSAGGSGQSMAEAAVAAIEWCHQSVRLAHQGMSERRRAQRESKAERQGAHVDGAAGKPKKKNMTRILIIIAVAWFALGFLLSVIGGGHMHEHEMQTDLSTASTIIFGLPVSQSAQITICILGIVLVLAILFRLLVVPAFKEVPEGAQNVAEIALDALDGLARGIYGHITDSLTCYMFTVAVYLVACAASELFMLRAPTSDIVVTGALAVITFIMINYYGIRKKGVGGRLKSLAQPMAFMFPINLLSHIAVPVSLACRLFGNMLGGMIVMELLRNALGFYATGPMAAAGLFFNLFHPLIQVYIFIMLSLTFIDEAVE